MRTKLLGTVFGLTAGTAALVLGAMQPAHATASLTLTSLTLTIDCIISGTNAIGQSSTGGADCISKTKTGPYGTLTFVAGSDGTKVDGTVDLTGAYNGRRIDAVFWNYDGALTGFSMSPDAGVYDQDDLQADGYSLGKFDLKIPTHGDGLNAADPYNFTVMCTEGGCGLGFADFFAQDPAHVLWAAFHIQGPPDGDTSLGTSLWLGALVGGGEAPEPGTLALFGAALAALGLARRRRSK